MTACSLSVVGMAGSAVGAVFVGATLLRSASCSLIAAGRDVLIAAGRHILIAAGRYILIAAGRKRQPLDECYQVSRSCSAVFSMGMVQVFPGRCNSINAPPRALLPIVMRPP